MKEPNIVILAGGISSRMRKAVQSSVEIDATLLNETQSKSKSMLGVGGNARPFLDYVLYNIEQAGYRDVVIVVGEKDPSIIDYYEQQSGKKQFGRLIISYATQMIPEGRTKPLGTADALLEVIKGKPDWKRQSFTVCNSDNIYSIRAMRLLMDDEHENVMIDYDRSALQFEPQRFEQFSVIKKDGDGFLLNIIEKPSFSDIETAKDASGRIGVSMNIFHFSYDMIFPFLESVPLHPLRQEKELPHAVKMMVAKYPRSMFTIPLSEHVIDLTSQGDIPEVREYLMKEFPDF
ncbi:MAG: sugar phosphate nucleotidyltransferase [Bacteroidota bacterium]|nr:sugar phosphate nucleotidyltransferase [Bacteroidota bacterium]